MNDLIELKILIVDDDPVERDRLGDHFVKEKCDIRMASDGSKALLICERFRPQVVLLDYYMPIMNGIQVLKRIKAKYPKTKVIMASGEDSLAANRESLKQGAFLYIVKPIDLDKLVEVVRRALGKDKSFDTKTI